MVLGWSRIERVMMRYSLGEVYIKKDVCLFVSLQGVTIVKPIVFGNVARYFGKKREEDGHTHQWTVYVKPYRNEVKTMLTLCNVVEVPLHNYSVNCVIEKIYDK